MNMKNEAIFNSEKELENFVEKNFSKLFGKGITLIDNNLKAEYIRPIRPDFLGRYKDGGYIIVELKFVRNAIESNDANSYYPMRLAVGQCLNYFNALAEQFMGSNELHEEILSAFSKFVKMYIVTDVYAKPIDNMCKVLRGNKFQIEYINAGSLSEK